MFYWWSPHISKHYLLLDYFHHQPDCSVHLHSKHSHSPHTPQCWNIPDIENLNLYVSSECLSFERNLTFKGGLGVPTCGPGRYHGFLFNVQNVTLTTRVFLYL